MFSGMVKTHSQPKKILAFLSSADPVSPYYRYIASIDKLIRRAFKSHPTKNPRSVRYISRVQLDPYSGIETSLGLRKYGELGARSLLLSCRGSLERVSVMHGEVNWVEKKT